MESVNATVPEAVVVERINAAIGGQIDDPEIQRSVREMDWEQFGREAFVNGAFVKRDGVDTEALARRIGVLRPHERIG